MSVQAVTFLNGFAFGVLYLVCGDERWCLVVADLGLDVSESASVDFLVVGFPFAVEQFASNGRSAFHIEFIL